MALLADNENMVIEVGRAMPEKRGGRCLCRLAVRRLSMAGPKVGCRRYQRLPVWDKTKAPLP